MKINIKNSMLERYIEQKELNILVANIYNSYLEEYKNALTETVVANCSETSNPIYYALLETLEIDPEDYEFERLAKNYKINQIVELNEKDYLNDPFFMNVNFKDLKNKKYVFNEIVYNPYELFLYDEVDIHQKDFYKETNKFGYFKSRVKSFELEINGSNKFTISPYKINTSKADLDKISGNILILGLGLGYFSYLSSLKNNVTSITVVEINTDLIELFNKEILPQLNTNKIKIINSDPYEYLSKHIEDFDFIYCDLYLDADNGLFTYIKLKHFESSFKHSKFIYWVETSILALLRRYVLIVFEEYINGYKEIDYKVAKNKYDKLINEIYLNLKNTVINNREALEKSLSNLSLAELASKIEIN